MGKTLADLQSNISISAEHAVSGTLNWVDDYTGFSSNPAELSGNYIALKIDTEASDEPLEGTTITATYHGRDVVLDSDQIIVVRHAEGEDTITFTASKEGYTTGVMTLDLSTLTFTPEPAKFSLTCNTPGITFTPNGTMAGGVATFEITATGQVPYDTTTSSNLINMTLTTNASPDYDLTDDSILIAYVDSEETTHTLYTGNLTWSDDVGTATFNCPITADSITYSPVIAIVVDGTNATRVSQVLDTSALTLAPDPTPKMNITSADVKTTITPATFNVAKTATGEVPYNTSGSYNYLALSLAYIGTWDLNYYKIVVYDDTATQIYDTPIYAGSTNLPSVIGVNPITSSNIGTGKYLDITIYSGETSQSLTTAVNTIRIDTSALTLESAPGPEVNITSNTIGITISPSTYATSKTATGTLQWNATYNTIDPFSITLQGNAYVSSSRYNITAYIEDDPTLVVGQETNKVLTSAFNMSCNIAAYIGTASYLTVAFSPNDLPAITIDITGLTAFDGKITPSGITYQGQTYSASDFISGETVKRSYNNTVIDGATIKYTTVNGVSGHYLAFTVPYTKYTTTSTPIKVYSIPTTADYEALVVDTSGFPSVNLIHFLGSAPTDITINVRYPSGVGESNLAVKLKFTNCTFETAP